jgi:phosphatidylcholine synthase
MTSPSTPAAIAVHVYTASGAVLALLALGSTVAGDYRAAFGWLFAATLIDATDGWLARRADVGRATPWIDGGRLDDIVDYLTFVFVPAVILREANLLPGPGGLVVAGILLVSSAFGFARTDAKTADHFFTGFPSYWNIVAFYLYAAQAGAAVNALVVLVLCVFVFVPIGYVYPSRTPVLQRLTLALAILWGATIAVMIALLPAVPRRLLILSLAFPVYYAALSLVLHRRRGKGRAASGLW